MKPSVKPNSQIMQEAAEWAEHVDHGRLSAEDRRALADWLLKSPDHVNEFLLASSVLRAFCEVDKARKISVEELLAERAPEVVPLLKSSNPAARNAASVENVQRPSGAPAAMRLRPGLIAASIALIAVFAAGVFFLFPDRSRVAESANVFATVTGEQRSVPLEDGSIVHLNTESEIRIRFADGRRDIELLRGEAMFNVARDPDRPFRVYAGAAIAEAVGTTFNVYRRSDETTVSVIEGKVAVETANSGEIQKVVDQPDAATSGIPAATDAAPSVAPRLTLVAGERASVRPGGEIRTARLENLEAVTSWRLRKLVFERETLETIVREYNRYNKLQIRIDDPALAETRFTGVFAADDPDSLLSFLELSGGIEAVRKRPDEVSLRSKNDGR